ncbi:hypothetical protein [Sphingomonas xinjiangensis]|uniref:Putative nucleic acid-binding Zn-ribbon protein n=1 Tax=Sphingomonas xinjiangensis TaxID=643568 RepID=A0A840YM56_9SPHN|nr:hypothetical protein [Sphingomonas xinjiangensis]MBB5710786.1 putative nucleic acid-binding Zn-ribbon protein [Sphingomonas xinjiangensis]
MTPFDTALRVHRREVDALKASISTEVDRIATLDTQTRAHEATLREERALAYAMPFASDAYTARMKAERIRLNDAANHAQIRLGALRDQTVEVYGTMRAIEGAAERYQDDADRTAAVAEQGAIDDIAAAKFLAARRKVRGR